MAAIQPPYFIIALIKKNSLNRLRLGGAEALPTHNKNQKNENIGDKQIIPRFNIILRDPLLLYKHCTP